MGTSIKRRENNDWNPSAYLRFRNERTQPAIDLAARIDHPRPVRIIDIGCGPGNSTAVLQSRWPEADILGVDISEAMIARARETYPDLRWEVKDAGDPGDARANDDAGYDIVFSNATIQWIPDHESLFRRLRGMLAPGGVLAVQMPLFHEMPLCGVIEDAFHGLFPASPFKHDRVFTYHGSDFYANLLCPAMANVRLWETSYLHLMDSAQRVHDMIESTGMRPYLEAAGDDEGRASLTRAVLAGIGRAYPVQPCGKVIFPFKRLFIVARM